jgi:cytochrome c oxidase subunit 2
MIAYTSLHWVMMPARRIETVDPATLHIRGEFVEGNLGSALEADGSVTVRMIGQQYSFTPPCILVPDRTPVRFRVTSADVIHGFLIQGTNVNVMLEPGYVSVFETQFKQPGERVMPCHEFCGTGHAGMWARVRVIERETFLRQAAGARRQSCVP